jgi:hypothetical protein
MRVATDKVLEDRGMVLEPTAAWSAKLHAIVIGESVADR